MPPPVDVRGRPAAPGVASGSLYHLQEEQVEQAPGGDAASEVEDLLTAVTSAAADLTRMAQDLDQDSADIIEFQIAMLEDDVLRAPALAAIEVGQTATEAWRVALAEQIAEYEASDEDYFRARVVDLIDIRDRVTRHLSGTVAKPLPAGAVVVSEDLTPTRFLESDWTAGGGLALTAGSTSSHVAILARARGVPMVVGLGDLDLNGHRQAIVDGDLGRLVLSPDPEVQAYYRRVTADAAQRHARESRFLHKPGRSRDGEAVQVQLNIMDPSELDGLEPDTCDGIGLMRSEFLFRDGAALPDEETQFRAYRRLLDWAGGKPVTVRTLDVGGDKPIAGLTPDGEANSFLGLRGVRLSLARPEVFKVQLRALARAATAGNLKVMLPMVTVPEELRQVHDMFQSVCAELEGEGVDYALPPLGIMVEVPAVAAAPDLFAEAAFFSIGSNDLTQYVTASARDNPAVDALCDPAHPAVLKLMRGVLDFGQHSGVEVSVCGDMAAESRFVPLLLGLGLRRFSVAPTALARIKATIAGTEVLDCNPADGGASRRHA
jgi:phosphotransferase system enzyme I (PtsI)